ncbi:MAG: c-type cytochrome [Desulfobacterales bacterium]|nr:c-type cytochrome [Desulfobacterales bacterium]
MNGSVKFKTFVFFFMIIAVAGVMFSLQFWQANAQSLAPSALEKPALSEPLFLKGKAVYEKQCAVCHGAAGLGDGKAAYLLYPKPRNFVEDNFRLVSTSSMEATDEDLFKTITRGMQGSSMPSWDFLSEEERWGVVYYLRYLKNLAEAKEKGEITDETVEKGLPWDVLRRLGSYEVDPEGRLQVPAELPVTVEGVSRGRDLFVKACAACHGLEGKGDGKQMMKDTLGYPVKPRDLTAGILKASASSEELFYRIAGGLPGSSMPGYKDAFTEEQIWDLIHYVQTLPDREKSVDVGLRRGRLTVHKVQGDLAAESGDSRWAGIEPVFIPLTPLWWRNDRVEGVQVKALYNEKQFAIHLEWEDETKDESTVAPQSFSDGAALQFTGEASPPIFAMGGMDSPVTLWHWKASWQEDAVSWKDIETKYPHAAADFYAAQTDYQHGAPFETRDYKTRAHDPLYATGRGAGNPLSDPERSSGGEEARAAGIGSLTTIRPSIEKVDVRGNYQNGKWEVVFVRELKVTDSDRLVFKFGSPMNIAFAIWDGAKGDRNGQKMVSFWNEMVFES